MSDGNAASDTSTRLFAWLLSTLCLLLLPQVSLAKERRGVVTVKVNLQAPADARRVDLWIPYPMSDENQEITEVIVSGNYSAMGVYREGKFGNNILHAGKRQNPDLCVSRQPKGSGNEGFPRKGRDVLQEGV
jgi:hypothetical protein